MRLLYVGNPIEKSTSGADQINRRNLLLLQQIFHDEIEVFELEPHNTIIDKLFFFIAGLTYSKVVELRLLIKSNHYDYIFISHSLLGRLCHDIFAIDRRIVIITFFHNIEKHYAQEFIRTSGILHLPFYFAAQFNEKRAVKYSNRVIVMNHREAGLLNKFYSRTDCEILPTSLEDKFEKNFKVSNHSTGEFIYLFVGVAFFANIEGLKWFVSNVFSAIKGRLIIAGKGMENYEEQFSSERIEVLGYVENLTELYERASFVVSPIFSGGGMKTKVAEALMYGKIVLGTSEAFIGYEVDNKSLYLCNTPEEYISTIEELTHDPLFCKFNQDARNLFEQYYSQDVAIHKMRKVLSIKS